MTAFPVGGFATPLADQPPPAGGHTRTVEVIAHRGASAHAPENTVPAIDLGVAAGADHVEIDVHMSRDGHVVVLHDATLDRTTDAATRYPGRAPWHVGDFTWAEIRALDAGSWFGERFAGTAVPDLQEVLDLLRGRAGLLLEVKSPGRYPRMVEVLVGELGSAGWLTAGRSRRPVVVQSFDWQFMARFRALVPDVPVGLLGRPTSMAQVAELSMWAEQINPDARDVTPAFVDAVHRLGMRTWPYTVDDDERMRGLIERGVDGIITNRPDVLTRVLADRRSRRPAA